MKTKQILSRVMSLAWQFVKRNGFTMSEALRVAWCNIKLHLKMQSQIVKFYFIKVDGTLREAYGTLASNLIPQAGESNRRKNDTVQVYFDTEKQEWRCFKLANLFKIA